MTSIEFKQLEFFEEEDKIKVVFLKHYTFIFSKEDLRLKNAVFTRSSISADDSEKSLNNAFGKILNKGLENLTNSVTGRKTIYVHQNSGIPLIGTNIFGIVDRNTNCIEIKPLTGCNLSCIYCSVDEGGCSESKKAVDYIVEKDYMVSELSKLIASKNDNPAGIEVHIGPQGEPALYAELAELIADIVAIDKVKRISMDTNGLLLSKALVDELVTSGITRFNISLNSMSKETNDTLSRRNYNLKHLLEMIRYIEETYASKGKCELIIAPVLLRGYNDSDEQLDALVSFAKTLTGTKTGIHIGIQNFLNYKNGRNPVKEKSWEEFFALLELHEKKHDMRLRLHAQDFLIEENNVLKKPFRKDETVSAEIVCKGQYPGEMIAAAKGRAIMIRDCRKEHGVVKARIIRDKHNVFDAVQLK